MRVVYHHDTEAIKERTTRPPSRPTNIRYTSFVTIRIRMFAVISVTSVVKVKFWF